MGRKEWMKSMERLIGRTGVRIAARRFVFREREQVQVQVHRVLVILLAAMGDAVNALPMLRRLRESLPHARIEMLTGPRALPILESSPDLDEILTVDIYGAPQKALLRMRQLIKEVNARNYDLVIDTEQYSALTGLVTLLSGAPKRVGFSTPGKQVDEAYTDLVRYEERRHESHCYLDLLTPLFGAAPDPERLVAVTVSKQEQLRADALLQELGYEGGLLVAVHPLSGSTATGRRWPLAQFVHLCRLLADTHGAHLLLVGSPEERETLQQMQQEIGERAMVAAGSTTIRELAALLSRVDAFVGNDSGPMHLAAAMGVRTVGLYGPNTPVKWGPLGQGNRAVSADLSCSPCINVARGQFKTCSNPICMTSIQPAQVVAALDLDNINHWGELV
ncbi:glycosyltransferase family 9 protein [Tumebacillus flagellatus]|uniref:Glycosyl transferase n=1 Tax=Tumebacillus flagellatus TaxID=1157490 RepID=A0A074LFJ4_9BACL|nr:glycosyltransferase family 9 protein [Tumebacillus flagellatus]KEO81016.1 hypothetical protein EL26_23030 [Tumebacillus flagellatus]